jgi:superoxide dismutase, Cu-Zn family
MTRFALAFAIALPLAAAAASQDKGSARAVLHDASGKEVGTATFTPAGDGVTVHLQVKGLPPGEHGLHVHGTGKCDAPDFMTSGSHFNPANKKHGKDNPDGAHAGDLANLNVGPDGNGHFEGTLTGVTLGDGPSSLFGKSGTALVVHGAKDDLKSDPGGNSGARIACGVIQRA